MAGCGNGTKVKDDPFLYRNHFPLPVRVMVGLFGLVLWLLPYSLLIAPRWNHFEWLLIPYGLIGLAGAIAGSVFLFSAMFGEARETKLDFGAQMLVQSARDWLYRPIETRTPFAAIAILELRRPAWATEESVFSIHPVLDNGDSLPAFGAFLSVEEAEKVKALMGHRPEGLDGLPPHWSKAELAALKCSLEAQAAQNADHPQGAAIPTLH